MRRYNPGYSHDAHACSCALSDAGNSAIFVNPLYPSATPNSQGTQRLSLLFLLARRTKRLVWRIRLFNSPAVSSVVYGGLSGSISSTWTLAPCPSTTRIATTTKSPYLLESEKIRHESWWGRVFQYGVLPGEHITKKK